VADGARLRESGVTIILTTHYIEEAEEMADRIGVISKGELIVVEDKHALMRKLGKKQLTLQLQTPLGRIPPALAGWPLALADDGHELVYTFDAGRATPASPAAAAARRAGHRLQGPAFQRELAGGHLRQPGARVQPGA
jgi:energy-coupling factor transporter ATP-binding protein EcfA2